MPLRVRLSHKPCACALVVERSPGTVEQVPVWFVIDAVAEMDLSPFYAAYRQDGHGRAAYEPAMMVTPTSA
jgi:hypothetical protein